MSDLEALVQTAHELSKKLEEYANNEQRFGHEMCHLLEQISYDTYKSANELKELTTYLVGDAA